MPGLDRPVPQLLTPLQQTLCRVGFVVCLTSFVVGSVGLGTLLGVCYAKLNGEEK